MGYSWIFDVVGEYSSWRELWGWWYILFFLCFYRYFYVIYYVSMLFYSFMICVVRFVYGILKYFEEFIWCEGIIVVVIMVWKRCILKDWLMYGGVKMKMMVVYIFCDMMMSFYKVYCMCRVFWDFMVGLFFWIFVYYCY